jgi:hypothetical protein
MSNKLKILIILVVMVSGVRLLIAAWDWYDRSSHSPTQAKARETARAAALKLPTEKPFLEISIEARTRLLEKLKKIKVEDTLEHVLDQLGTPNSDQRDRSNLEFIPGSIGSRILIYQIRKQKPDELDETNDEHIYIFLDGDEQVAYIYTRLRQP